ncbi:amidohydrolase family protein [Cognatishimia sp. SS12]|uniref:amidohydrolase family protein n=1 Tax=Cognatishimia sp. SS12 TaxID=2979465 RepID=UPI00232E7585|nr:amidohydrolase family protein [Cognatishimia sp. SS12]MDC0737791.1 amidohydrolase family protein [Cognatishimia sp. SS12]
MRIDAHQHFWTLARGDYPWPNASVAPIFRDFGPKDLAPLISVAGIDETVLVQATDTVAETEFLLKIATQTPWVAGVVGWVDLQADGAIEMIDYLRANPYLKGLRPMLQNISETDWILNAAAQPALAHMAAQNLCFDALVQPRHLPVILELSQRHPNLKIVIDHIAKPTMGGGTMPARDWSRGMSQLAAQPNVYCKLSGLLTEVGPNWRSDDVAPFAAHVLNAFGASKVMFGSDWPVLSLAATYSEWCALVEGYLAGFSPHERSAIMGETAMHFYGLGDDAEGKKNDTTHGNGDRDPS